LRPYLRQIGSEFNDYYDYSGGVGGRNKQIKPRSYCAGAQIGKLAKWAKVCISGRLISRAKPWAQSVERSAARKAKKEILWVAKQEVCHTQSASSQETSRDEMVWDGMGVLGGCSGSRNPRVRNRVRIQLRVRVRVLARAHSKLELDKY